MTYKINKTDGSLLTEVVDSVIDRTSTDLVLIGKNVTGYGEFLNENFVKLLENFSSTSEPMHPITGQLWFDLTESRIKVYDGNGFRLGAGPVVAASAPLSPIQGDLWIDNTNKIMYFYDSTGSKYLTSKIWTDEQGKSGFEVESLRDNFGNTKTVTKLYTAGSLVGIFSNHSEFTPSPSISGFPTIKTGFTGPATSGFKFYARSTSSDALVDVLGNLKTAGDFLSTGSNAMNGQLKIINQTPLILGVNQANSISISDTQFQLTSIWDNQDFIINTKRSNVISVDTAFKIDTSEKYVGIFTPTPASTLDVNGDVTVRGNLIVEGQTVTVNSSTLTITDKNIELAVVISGIISLTGKIGSVSGSGPWTAVISNMTDTVGLVIGAEINAETGVGNIGQGGVHVVTSINKTSVTYKSTGGVIPVVGSISNIVSTGVTDLTADGGGLILKGSVDHSILWTPESGGTWSSSENFNIPPSSAYRVGNIDVLTQSKLGSTVTTALGLTEIGTLRELQVASINISNNIISSTSDIILNPSVTKVLDISFSRIANLIPPLNDEDASTKKYVDDTVSEVVGYPWQEIDRQYNASTGDRLLVKTSTGPVYITLPPNPNPGSTLRIVDYEGTFDIDPVVIVRNRAANKLSITGVAFRIGDFLSPIPTTTITGSGTGLTVTVTIISSGTYTGATALINTVNQGVGYRNGDSIKVLGSSLGGSSPANDLIFEIQQENIFGLDQDVTLTLKHLAIGFVYTNLSNGWQYLENYKLPAVIESEFIGNLTGNVTGNLTGNVTGNITGTVLSPDQSLITSIGTLGYLAVSNMITGNLTGTTFGTHVGDLVSTSVKSNTSLTIEAASGAITVKSRNNIIVGVTSTDAAQEQHIFEMSPGATALAFPTTKLYGNIVVDNSTTSNSSGSSFRLPNYTTVQRNARASHLGELIYNIDVHKVQAYANGIWIDL